MTVEATTGPSGGLSLEVGATYRHPTFGECVLGSTERDGDGCVPVRSAAGFWQAVDPDRLVRVVPTPPDHWLVLDRNGGGKNWFSDEGRAVRYSERYPDMGPYTIARYSFAGWVDPAGTAEEPSNG